MNLIANTRALSCRGVAEEDRVLSPPRAHLWYMFLTLHALYAERKVPRPYEALLEQHRALVATNVSRLSGNPVRLDSLGGTDNVGWHDELRNWFLRFRLEKKAAKNG